MVEGGGSRIYVRTYSQKGLLQFAEGLLNIRHFTIQLSSTYLSVHGYIQRHLPEVRIRLIVLKLRNTARPRTTRIDKVAGQNFKCLFCFCRPQ